MIIIFNTITVNSRLPLKKNYFTQLEHKIMYICTNLYSPYDAISVRNIQYIEFTLIVYEVIVHKQREEINTTRYISDY